jgi:hypothetical protein
MQNYIHRYSQVYGVTIYGVWIYDRIYYTFTEYKYK